MKVLIDVRLLGRGGLSGIEEYTRELLTHIFESDKENHYALFYNGFKKTPLPQAWIEKKNVSVLDWKIPNKIFDAETRFLNRPKISDFTDADIIFSPHFNILNPGSIPRIITFHDLSFVHHPYFFNARQKLWHWIQNYQKQAYEAKKIIANSEFTKNDLINTLKIPENKIEVVYPGINPIFRKLNSEDENLNKFRREKKLEFPFILYLGTLEPRKNIAAIIRAFSLMVQDRKFRDLRLVLAGKPGWLHSGIIKEARNSPARDRIAFLGPVENRERVFLYNLAEGFVYPSFFEGFGFPPLEAQACGCPVVVSERTALAETIGKSGITADPWRVEALAEILKKILGQKTLRQELIKSGLENARKFTWEKAVHKILKIFNSASNAQKISH